MRIDIQVNGGGGLLFNKITNLDDFLKIELNHLKQGKAFIVPTFITDSHTQLENFIKIVKQRILLNKKQYLIDDFKIILPELFAIHIEGPFITNKGTHPAQYVKDFNEENVANIVELLKPLNNLPIYFTIAPELIINKTHLLKKLKASLNIKLSAGHTKITKNDFTILQNQLGDHRIKMITHLHNAMLGGHFNSDDGIPDYINESDFDGYFGFIMDGQHTAKGELLPTILNYYNNICAVSDSASPACCNIDSNNNLFEMGGSIGVVEQKPNELPTFFWTDLSKNQNINSIDLEELYRLYINGDGGYKTLAGSAVHLEQCCEFLKNLNIEKEIQKTKENKKAKALFEIGLNKLKIEEKDIKNFIIKNLDKMFIENPIKALNINQDIKNYNFIDNKLFYKDQLFICFDEKFDKFLKSNFEDQNLLKEKIKEYLNSLYKR